MITSTFKSKPFVFVWSLAVALFFLGFWGKMELGEIVSFTWQDFLYSTRINQGESVQDIVIVAVDEPSFKELGQKWPWPRRMHARVVDNLAQAGVKAIVFDMLFSEPATDPADDEIFAAAMKKAGNVSIGKFSSHTRREQYVQSIVVEPVQILKEAAAVTGFVNHFPDNDGIVRYAYKYLDNSYSLAYSGCMAAFPNGAGCRKCSENTFLIDYRPESANIPIVSYYQVLNNLMTGDFFKDKLVMIGLGSNVKVDAQGAVDAYPTPFFRFKKQMMHGVEIHTNVLITLLTGCRLKRLDSPVLNIFFLCFAMAPFWVRQKPMFLTATGICGILTLAGLSLFLFNIYGLMVDVMPAALAVTVNTLFLGLNEFRQTHKERRYLKHAFESYVSSDIVRTILENPSALALGGERKELTVMFTDINGFTTVSESLEPEELVSVLNDYLQFITQVILKHEGTLDKYIGDEVMAFFGAPVHFGDHAQKACAAALSLDGRLNRKQKIPEIVFSGITIGINTGQMIVGNVGSKKRFDYTVIGDTVNLASRLEGLNKTYGTSMIIGENTRRLLPENTFLTREMDYVKVKGKHQAISIYELMEHTKENLESIVVPFAEGLAAYRQQDWGKGQTVFQSILEKHPTDGPSRVFLERCRFFADNPLPENWDMVWEMTIK